MTDARFEDGGERPLRLRAMAPDDVPVIAALVQDALIPTGEISWSPRKQRFAVLLNRFRWEDKAAAERAGRAYERVQSVLCIDSALRVVSDGVDPRDKDLVLSLLSLTWDPGEDGTGRMHLILAGDGQIAVDAECLDLTLSDVTRPYAAPSGKAPGHG